jgi:hypothetical protein
MRTIAAMLVVVGFSCAPCLAQQSGFPPGPCVFSKEDPLAAATKCKVLADGGDPDAMFQFGIMLLAFAPEPGRADAEELARWQGLGNRLSAARWLDGAAEQGSRQAMELKCRIASDPLAPQGRREEGKRWCGKIETAQSEDRR